MWELVETQDLASPQLSCFVASVRAWPLYLFHLCALLISDAAICNIFAKPRFDLSVLLSVVLWRENIELALHSLNLSKTIH